MHTPDDAAANFLVTPSPETFAAAIESTARAVESNAAPPVEPAAARAADASADASTTATKQPATKDEGALPTARHDEQEFSLSISDGVSMGSFCSELSWVYWQAGVGYR